MKKTIILLVALLPLFLSAQIVTPNCVIHGIGENRTFVGSYHGNGTIIDFKEKAVTEPLKSIFVQYRVDSFYVEGKPIGTSVLLSSGTKGMTPQEEFFFSLGVEKIKGIDTRINFLNSKGIYSNEAAVAFHEKVRITAKLIKDSLMKKSSTGPEYFLVRNLTNEEVINLNDYFEMSLEHSGFEQNLSNLPDSTMALVGVAHLVSLAAHQVPGRYYLLVNSADLDRLVDDYYQDQCLMRALLQIKKNRK